MITKFEAFCLCCYVLIDDLWRRLAPRLARPGPDPICADRELITRALVGECRGWDQESNMVRHWREDPPLLPHPPGRRRRHPRRRHVGPRSDAPPPTPPRGRGAGPP